MRKESSIVLVRVNHVQGQHPTQVKEKRNVKRESSMDIRKINIGDKVCNKEDGFPMTVVGLYSTLADLSNGTVYLDFEGNEGDMWEEEAKDLIPYDV